MLSGVSKVLRSYKVSEVPVGTKKKIFRVNREHQRV